MNEEKTIAVLNRLVVLHHRSLAMYLSYASPSWHRSDERSREGLQTMAREQEAIVDQLGEQIVELDGVVQFGGFPMTFTGLHDLSFDYLLERLLLHQQTTIASIEEAVEQLSDAPLAKSLAQQALASARNHRELLQGLRQPAATGE